MKFSETSLHGAYIIAVEAHADERGLFARTYCEREFAAQSLHTRFVQENTSFNLLRGTVRGLHFQSEPRTEVKMVRCVRGRIFDVIVDLRRDSKTYRRWHGVELGQDNRLSLYIPKGFAHGFQTLENDCEILYHMSEFFDASLVQGIRYDDPIIGIKWPLLISRISERDLNLPLLSNEGDSL